MINAASGTNTKWKQYPTYKDSGVEWLGEVPELWVIERLKFNSYIKGRIGWQNLRSDEFTDEGPYLITGMHFLGGSVDWDSCYHITRERYEMAKEIQVREQDILITKDGSIGKVAYIDHLPGEASLNSHLLIIRPLANQYIPRYLYYLLNSSVFIGYISLTQTGTTFFGITQESVENFPIFLPSNDEQHAIAVFLDREIAKIDALIAMKVQLIELLQEKRVSLISHAVTKGLDPRVPLKDSRVEWLGEIPEHWEIWRISHAFKMIGSGTTPSTDNVEYYDGIIPWVTTSELRENIIKDTTSKLTEKALKDHSVLSLYPAGTLLIAMYGATIGRLSILGVRACTNQACCAFADSDVLDIRFVFYSLLMRRQDIIMMSSGGGQPNINQEKLRSLKAAAPSIIEQRAIASFLDHETAKIDTLSSKIQNTIEKLKEYRSALISAAVTGKIDVRNEVGGVA